MGVLCRWEVVFFILGRDIKFWYHGITVVARSVTRR